MTPEDQMRDDVMAIFHEGKAMRAPDDIIARAIGLYFIGNNLPAPRGSLVKWLEASGRWTRGTKH